MAKTAICVRPAYGGNRHMAKTLLAMRSNEVRSHRTNRKIILLAMKLIIILLTVALLNVSAKGLSQSISFTGKNVPLKKIFTAIEKQTGYTVSYTDDVLTGARPVSITAQNVSLRNFLVLILKGQPIDFSIEDKSVLLFRKTALTDLSGQPSSPSNLPDTAAPPIDINGRVVNEKKEPVEGVTVQVKGLTKNTITNKNGAFALSTIDPAAVLVFTHISMEPAELQVNGRTDLSVSLKTKVNALNNVTVTVNNGYQRIPKERATGSFDYLSNEALNKQVSTGILPRLEAIANGLTIDRISTGNKFSIRGFSSIMGPKDPLIIVDNFPYEGDINNINPNDVEDITILKDAAAASIWGTRAGNGVIVITTKKARFNQALKMEVNTNVTVGTKPNLFYIQQASSNDFIDAELFLFSKQFRFGDTSSSIRSPFSPVYEILFSRRKGLISAADSVTRIDALRETDIRNDYNKYVYRGAFNQQHAINISSGADKYSWIFSSGYDRNIDELDATYDRLNLRFHNSYKPVRNLLIQAGIYYTQTNTGSGKPAYGTIVSTGNGFAPYTQLADQNGHPLSIVKDYRSVYIDTAGAGKLLDWKYLPLDDYKHAFSKNRSSSALINIGLGYQLFTGLNIDLQYQYERQTGNGRTLYDEFSYQARNLVNRFAQINGNTVTFIVPKGGILDLSQSLLQSSNLRAQLNYNRKWAKHAVTAILGAELREINTQGNRSRTYGYNDNNNVYGVVDYTKTYREYHSGNSAFILRNDGMADITNRFVSMFGNAAYTFLDRYTFSVSGRRDGSNLFGAATNDKWKPLSSYGVSWDISKEPFYQLAWLPFLKVRATYGTSGNADASKVGLTTLFYRGLSSYSQLPFSHIDNYYNPELKWESVKMTNIALDFSAFQNRVSGSVDYYIKKGQDLFGNTPVDYTGTGTTNLVKNVASIHVRGLDVNLNTKNIEGDFTWTTRVNFSLNRDKVTKYFQSTVLGTNFVTGSLRIAGLEGKPIYSIFSYRWAGLDPANGDPQGYFNKQVSKNYNLLINDSLSNLVYSGPALPRVFGSVSNTFSWKGLSLTAAILFKFRYYFRRPTINYDYMYNTWNGHADLAYRWQKPGDEKITTVPSMNYPGNSSRDQFYAGSEVRVEKGDHIRLQFITLDYDVTRLVAKTKVFRLLQVYFNANNPGIIWRANDHHLDPEYYTGYSMPPAKTFAVGIRTIL
jgi:TonB-linked SusC/RagA family outer membrane protein